MSDECGNEQRADAARAKLPHALAHRFVEIEPGSATARQLSDAIKRAGRLLTRVGMTLA